MDGFRSECAGMTIVVNVEDALKAKTAIYRAYLSGGLDMVRFMQTALMLQKASEDILMDLHSIEPLQQQLNAQRHQTQSLLPQLGSSEKIQQLAMLLGRELYLYLIKFISPFASWQVVFCDAKRIVLNINTPL